MLARSTINIEVQPLASLLVLLFFATQMQAVHENSEPHTCNDEAEHTNYILRSHVCNMMT